MNFGIIICKLKEFKIELIFKSKINNIIHIITKYNILLTTTIYCILVRSICEPIYS